VKPDLSFFETPNRYPPFSCLSTPLPLHFSSFFQSFFFFGFHSFVFLTLYVCPSAASRSVSVSFYLKKWILRFSVSSFHFLGTRPLGSIAEALGVV